ncbi:MAG: hypothetical protein MUE90_01740 [Thermoanaerobaculales bacterium]|nr:hypothetical protein [Thermoanaerobaculales bacterium]
MEHGISPRELAYCGLFGAAALLLPTLFHLLRLGHVFMPMYLPLVALAFFVGPRPAAATALVTPLLSGAVTGMPPYFPPVAPIMALELALMAALLGAARRRWPDLRALALLLPVLALGRVVHVALVYAAAAVVELPAAFMAGLSFLSGWPGIVLMLLVVPTLVEIGKSTGTIRPVAATVQADD